MAPYFITLEGLDGSGKSTQLRRLASWLAERGVAHRVTQEPGGTAIGEAIRTIFLRHDWTTADGLVEALLIFASRRQHLQEVIEPALQAGQHVLCDRFTDSTFAYQGYGRGVSLEVLRRVDELATAGRVPDRTLLFDLPAEEARRRGQSARRRGEPDGVDRLDGEDLEFYRRVRAGYLELAASRPERFRVIDSQGPVEATTRQTVTALADLLGDRR